MRLFLVLFFLLTFMAVPVFATEEQDAGFGGAPFANTQLPGFTDPAPVEDDAASVAGIEPAAGDETADKTSDDEIAKPKTQHETGPVGPASAIGATPDEVD